MSEKLLNSAKIFLNNKSDAEIFVDEFISQWKQERDNGAALYDAPQISEALSSIFCVADMFNPHEDRESYEFNEPKLRSETEKILKKARIL